MKDDEVRELQKEQKSYVTWQALGIVVTILLSAWGYLMSKVSDMQVSYNVMSGTLTEVKTDVKWIKSFIGNSTALSDNSADKNISKK